MPRNRSESAKLAARSARRNPSVAEAIAWKFLQASQLGFKFKREHPLLGYRLDFYCHEARLGIEFDGEQHISERDDVRDERLAEVGVAIFRIPNRSFFMVDSANMPTDWLRLVQEECVKRTGRAAFP